MEVKVKVIPKHGWSSYVVSIYVPEVRHDIVGFVDDWVHDNLNNVDTWKIL